MPIIDHFGIIAPFYDQIFSPSRVEKLMNKVDLPPGGTLLDAGGGTGRISQALGSDSGETVIADLSFEMLLQTKYKKRLLAVCSHTENLPFPNREFDRIIMIDALHHVCNQAETAKELLRVLKPGGRIIIEEPNIHKFGVKVLATVEKLIGMRSYFLTPEKIGDLFNGNEIRIDRDGFNCWVIVESVSI